MKLTKLYNELTNKHTNRESSINKHYKEKTEQGQINTDHQNFRVNESLKSNRFLGELNQNFEVSNNTQSNMSLENIKIIGVTGSKGKSTVAYLTHKYLEHIGKKSVLYSSIEIDSKASNKASKQACETSITNESIILDILEEASVYQAEYVVLEINESAIAQGLIKDIPFSIRALTNIEKSNSEEFMDSKIYVENKKSFFRNIPTEDRCVSIFGLTGSFTRDDFNELLSLSDNEIITYGSKYICENRNADYTNIDFLLKTNSDKKLETLDGLRFSIKIRNSKEIHVETGIMGTFNALNITLVAAILDALGILKTVEFSDFLQGVNIPGRNEVIKTNNRTIVIGVSLAPTLEGFKKLKELNEIYMLKVVIGSSGTGFKYWDDKFQSSRRIGLLAIHREFAMNYVSNNADYAYLTSSDPAASNPTDIANEMNSYVDNRIPTQIIVDRKIAIKQAILESNPGDLIFIAGRGNRQYYCKSGTDFDLFTDLEVVEAVIKDLGW